MGTTSQRRSSNGLLTTASHRFLFPDVRERKHGRSVIPLGLSPYERTDAGASGSAVCCDAVSRLRCIAPGSWGIGPGSFAQVSASVPLSHPQQLSVALRHRGDRRVSSSHGGAGLAAVPATRGCRDMAATRRRAERLARAIGPRDGLDVVRRAPPSLGPSRSRRGQAVALGARGLWNRGCFLLRS
jgi:hypothetical protein